MRTKSAVKIIVAGILCSLFSWPALAYEVSESEIAPPSPEFIKWQKSLKTENVFSSAGGSSHAKGYRPSPVDLSHLAKNRTKINADNHSKVGDSTFPSTYDLRNYGRVPAEVKDQNPYNACWSFAAMGALESNYMTQGLGELDLSELHLAWFSYKDSERGSSFYITKPSDVIMDQGGNAVMSIAYLSRMTGPVNESSMPYSATGALPLISDRILSFYVGSKTPSDYHPLMLRLKDAYLFGHANNSSYRAAMRPEIKKMIMENGAVQISYFAGEGATSPSGGTIAYFNNNGDPNHAVLIVGWDDNFSRENFSTREANRPSENGAWLIRNSWGKNWPEEENGNGYFWMSYEQNLYDVTVYIAEPLEEDLKHYGYDALGLTGTASFGSNWAANIFKAERDNEAIKEIGFYTIDDNVSYEVYIYDLGTNTPSSPVPSDTARSIYKSTGNEVPYSGYHTQVLDRLVPISKGHYFSVVIRMILTDSSSSPAWAVEGTVQDYAYPVVNAGESWRSTYVTGNTIPSEIYWSDCQSAGYNVCIKAFSVLIDTSWTAISSNNFPDDNFRAYIENNLDADKNGYLSEAEISAVTSLNISGLNISSLAGIENFTSLTNLNCSNNNLASLDVSGLQNLSVFNASPQNITGLKVKKLSDNYYAVNLENIVSIDMSKILSTENITVFNSLPESIVYEYDTGFISAGENVYMSVTVSPADSPAIISAYVPEAERGKNYSVTLESFGETPLSWSIYDGSLPTGLSLNNSAGMITGTPEISGSFNFTVRASNEYGYDFQELTLNVKEGAPEQDPKSQDITPEYPDVPTPNKPENLEPSVDVNDSGTAGTIRNLLREVTNFITANTEVLKLADNASVGTERTGLTSYELAKIPEGEEVVLIMPVIRVTKPAIYVWGIDLSKLSAGKLIFMHMMSESDSNASGFYAADARDNAYTFIEDDGKEVKTVPLNKHVNVAAYLEAGKTYAPVITTKSSGSNGNNNSDNNNVSPKQDNDNTSGGNESSSGGGGCSTASLGIIMLAVLLTAKRKY